MSVLTAYGRDGHQPPAQGEVAGGGRSHWPRLNGAWPQGRWCHVPEMMMKQIEEESGLFVSDSKGLT